MNNFKTGDQVDWVTDFCDNNKYEWPGVVICTFESLAGTIAQFYIRKKGDTKGRMTVKEWLVCHLKPHQPKPRYRLRSLFQLRVGDKVWTPALGTVIWTEHHIIESNRWHPDGLCAMYVGQRQVWAEVRHD